MTCKAHRVNDQMECGRCGLQWDVDDLDRPPCRTDKELTKERGLREIREIRQNLEVDIVHTCRNCEFNEVQHCAYKHWGAGEEVNRDPLQLLMNVDNSKCPRWRLKK